MKPVIPNFYFISETRKSLSVRSGSLQKLCRVENFHVNVLKGLVIHSTQQIYDISKIYQRIQEILTGFFLNSLHKSSK